MNKALKLCSIIPLFFVFCLFCFGLSFQRTSASAKTDDFEAFSQSFYTMMQNADNNYVDPIYINLDHDASLMSQTYMIDVATFSEIADVEVLDCGDGVEICNDFASLNLAEENGTLTLSQKSQALKNTALYDNGVLYLPLEEVATNLGYNVDINKDIATLTRPYQTKRVVVETNQKVNSFDASFVAEGYNGLHIFQYKTESETKDAFEFLTKTYKDALVYLDSVVCLDDAQLNGKTDDFSYTTWGAQATGVKEYSTYLLGSELEKNLPEVVVAVLDTGIDTDHPWFENRIKEGGRSYYSNSPVSSYEDDNGHGTHVAGTIVDMTLKNVKILPIKVLGSDGYGSSVNIRYALEYVINQKNAGQNIVAINMSFGSESAVGGSEQKAYKTILDNAYQKGILCVAAAGNDHKDASAQSPANVPIVITVSAVKLNSNNQVYEFDSAYSNYGAYVDFCAPGTSIESARKGGGTTTMSGTSMAAPHISAIIALLYSDTKEENLTPTSIENKLKEFSIDLGETGWDQYYGYGLPDIRCAHSSTVKDVEFSTYETQVPSSFYLTLSHQNLAAQIYYTLDGTEPSQTNGTLYESPIFIDKTTVVKAVAVVLDEFDEAVSSFVKTMTYIVDNQDFDYNFVVENGVIKSYEGNFQTLKIASQINGQTVTKIGPNAFSSSGCSIIYLPETVTEIESNAFENMTSLTEIFAPGVTKTGNYSFSNCYSLDKIDDQHFPNLLVVGKLCFYDCFSITSVNLSKATLVDYWAFSMSGYQNSTLLKSVNLPNAKTLNGGAFYYCTNLKQVDLPKCQIVASNAFYCTAITNISLPEVVLIGSKSFYGCSNLKSVDFPKAITVGDSCFDELTSLSSVNLPELQLAGAFAFNACVSLTTLNLPQLAKAGAFAFANCQALSEFDFSNLKQIGVSAFAGTNFETINLPCATQISKNAFAGNTNLKTVKLSPNLEVFESPFEQSIYSQLVLHVYQETVAQTFADENNIAYALLDDISNLSFYVQNKKVFLTGFVDDGSEIIIPSTILGKPVEVVCENAFVGAQNLKKVISSNIKIVEKNAFAGALNLETFECPNVTTIQDNAFLGCQKLVNLNISNAKFVGDNAFLGCDNLGYAMLSKNIEHVGYKAFGFDANGNLRIEFVLYGYEDTAASLFAAMYDVTFAAKFNELSRYYYNYVDSTKTDIYISFVDESVSGRISLPAVFKDDQQVEHTVVSIGSQAFSYCSFITEILLPQTITTIEANAFVGCSLLRSINLENVTTLGRYAFQDCTSLQSANLQSLGIVPAYAFFGCYALETVNAENAQTVGYRAFANCIGLRNINLTNAQVLGTVSGSNLYGNVFENCQSLEFVALPKVSRFGTSLFDGAGTKFVALSSTSISAIYNSSISNTITIYGYAGTNAQTYATKNSNPFVEIQNFAITKNLETSINLNQFDECVLMVNSTGFLQTYKWFLNGEPVDETSNTFVVDTNNFGTNTYYAVVTNFDGQTIVSNVCTVVVLENESQVLVDYKIYGLGSISLEDDNIFEIGSDAIITFSPELGWNVSKIWIDGILLSENETTNAKENGFCFENISNSHLLEVLFETQSFTITVNAENANVLNLLESYVYGSSTTLYVKPTSGYEISKIYVNGVLCENTSKIVLSNIVQNYIVTILATPRTDTPYTVLHLVQSFHETIYLIDGQYYDVFETETKVGTTNQQTQAVAKTIEGCSAKSFSQTNISGEGNSVVQILYTRNVFSLSLTKNTGFSSVEGAGNYLFGQLVTISATLRENCTFSCWQSCDESVLASSTTLNFSFFMPAQNFSFKAIAIVPTYLISVDSVLYGEETTKSSEVNMEEDFVVNIVPDVGFEIDTICVDGATLLPEDLQTAKQQKTFTFGKVTQNHRIQITYAPILFDVSFTKEGCGDVSITNFNATILDTTTVYIIPENGYEISKILQNDAEILGINFENVLNNGFVVQNISGDTNFKVVFKIKTFKILSNADSSLGYVSSSKTVDFGQDATFVIYPFVGNLLKDVVVDGQSVGAVQEYVFENVTQNHTINVIFEKIVLNVDVTIFGLGTCGGNTTAFYGEEVNIAFVPSVGYEVHNVLLNGVSLGSVSQISISNITQNQSIEVTFTKILLTVTIECSEHGTVKFGENLDTRMSNTKTIEYGDSVNLVIVPEESFGIDYILKNGEYQTVSKTINFSATENVEIYVHFAQEFQIISTSEGFGEISESALVSFGESKTFWIKAKGGYVIDDVVVDGKSVGSVETYTFDDVDTRHTINAIFSVETFKIITEVDGSGAIVVDNLDPAVYGETRTFTFVPQDGYKLTFVYVNGQPVSIEDGTLVLEIRQDSTIKAVFEKLNTLTIVIALSSCVAGLGFITLIIAICLAQKRK